MLSHKARAPGTEAVLGRSCTLGMAKTLLASPSTTSRFGFCFSCVCGLVGVVLGLDPLLFGNTLSSISLSSTLALCVWAGVESDGSVDDRFRTLVPGSYILPLDCREA